MRKKDHTPSISKEDLKSIRRASRESEVAALREGRKIRSVTFIDRKKEKNKTICRNKIQNWTN